MKHTQLNEFLTHKVLDHKMQRTWQSELIDQFTDEDDSHIKNMCAKVHISLIEELERACDVLGCSKRIFIESAVVEALRQYNEVADEYGIFEGEDE